MMKRVIKVVQILAVIACMLLQSTLISYGQQKKKGVEDLYEEVQRAEAKLKESNNWPISLKQSYEKSLEILHAKLNLAVDEEMDQTNELLDTITESEARKPLETHLAKLRQFKASVKQNSNGQFATVSNVKPAAKESNERDSTKELAKELVKELKKELTKNDNANGEDKPAKPADDNKPADDKNKGDGSSSTPVPVTITVKTVEKGKDFLIEGVRIKLLKLNPQIPEYEEIDGIDAKTDKEGIATIDAVELAPATYKVTATKDGYFRFTQKDQFVVAANTVSSPGAKPPAKDIPKSKNLKSESAPSGANSSGGTPPKKEDEKKNSIYVLAECSPLSDQYIRSIVGFEQSGASSQKSRQNIFLNFFISTPLLKGKRLNSPTSDSEPRFRVWGDTRITSVPKQSQDLFKALTGSLVNTVSEGFSAISDSRLSASFVSGLQINLHQGYIGGKKIVGSIIFGGGAITPLSTDNSVQIFKIPDPVNDAPRFNQLVEQIRQIGGIPNIGTKPTDSTDSAIIAQALMNKKNIAFVLKDRDRFFRNYFGGIRLETYLNDINPNQSPLLFDVTIGQDEAVTGGRVQSAVLRMDGFVPIPKIGKGEVIYLFGSANLALKRSRTQNPVLLAASGTDVMATDSSTIVVPTPASNRDLFRVGLGIDLVRLLKGSNGNGNGNGK